MNKNSNNNFDWELEQQKAQIIVLDARLTSLQTTMICNDVKQTCKEIQREMEELASKKEESKSKKAKGRN